MKVINTGNKYVIYDDSLKTCDQLPAQNYLVNFHPMQGFYLSKYSDIEINEKVYGVHEEKVNKVLNTFNIYTRSLGVILSGNKGIGKSLFAKMLATSAVEKGIPVIVVDKFIPGIAAYIESIEQEVMVLFDEFDKTFGNVRQGDNETDAQTSMLTLFDGISQGKKLFVITCNEVYKLSDYLVNRPGRFHYHFRFEYPTVEEVKEYLQDKLDEAYHNQIDKVASFSRKVDLNYDCLRAIAFELSLGLSFEEAIKDLNIVNMKKEEYTAYLVFEDGETIKTRDVKMDLFSSEQEKVYLYNKDYDCMGYVEFNPDNCLYDASIGANYIQADDLTINYYGTPGNKEDEEYYGNSRYRDKKVKGLILKRKVEKSIHYAA